MSVCVHVFNLGCPEPGTLYTRIVCRSNVRLNWLRCVHLPATDSGWTQLIIVIDYYLVLLVCMYVCVYSLISYLLNADGIWFINQQYEWKPNCSDGLAEQIIPMYYESIISLFMHEFTNFVDFCKKDSLKWPVYL